MFLTSGRFITLGLFDTVHTFQQARLLYTPVVCHLHSQCVHTQAISERQAEFVVYHLHSQCVHTLKAVTD